jgi:methionyl-tRNA formyltransferase
VFFSDKNEEWTIKIYEASLLSESHDFELGKIICPKKEMKIAVEDGFIQIVFTFPGKRK